MLGILRAHRVDVLDPRLMRHLQPAAKGDGQHGEAVGHHLAEDARTLAAAGDEDAEDAVLLQQRIGFRAQRQHRLAHRIADEVDLALVLRREAFGRPVRGRDRIDLARDDAVDAAEDGVLLMDRGRDLLREGGEQRGEGGIAAEADDGGRLERAVQFTRHRPAAPHLADRARPALRLLHLEAARGQDVRLDTVEQAREAHAARVADQRHAMAAPGQFLRQRRGGDHVTARATGSEDVMLVQFEPHLTT